VISESCREFRAVSRFSSLLHLAGQEDAMKRLTTFLSLALLAVATNADAQQWDATGQVALLKRNKPELTEFDHWYSVAAVDGTVGRYWTPHFKTEFEIGTAAEGTIDGAANVPVPGRSYPYYRYREHKLRETTAGAAVMYQFFDNRWVHPFVGGGFEVARERHFADSLPAGTVRVSTAVPTLSLPAVPAIDTVTYSVRPVLNGGFKFYVTPHGFVRTEVRTSFGADRPAAVQWRGGAGFDF
jgi:hypothetical protein